MADVIERFLDYVKINTQSQEDVDQLPSTDVQWDLGHFLVDELKRIGAQDISISDHCYVFATIPATDAEYAKKPVIGFISHMDTSDAVSGKNVKPRIVENYDGKDIVLNSDENIILAVDKFPSLKKYVGKDLIVTDGTTLLGADDKAGIAEIMTMAEYLINHPEIKHGKIRVAFTPDEEVGRGTDFFDVEGFGADYAYTVDGGELGEIEYECFNAAAAKVHINGVSVHPGSAKDQMINAAEVGMYFNSLLPALEKPCFTEGYEGFYHLTDMTANVNEADLNYILRDFFADGLERRKETVLKAVEQTNRIYGPDTVSVIIKDNYRNMREKVEEHMDIVEAVKTAMTACDVPYEVVPIRGGTDGARLSFMGLPCPNICTGGANFHGRYEYVPVQSMKKVVDILIYLATR